MVGLPHGKRHDKFLAWLQLTIHDPHSGSNRPLWGSQLFNSFGSAITHPDNNQKTADIVRRVGFSNTVTDHPTRNRTGRSRNRLAATLPNLFAQCGTT